MDIKVTVDLSDRVMGILSKLGNPLMTVVADAPAKTTKPEPEKETPAADTTSPATLPDFTTEDAKRKWLVEQIIAAGIEIPPRTRTTTLENTWVKLQAKAAEGGEPEKTEDPGADLETGEPEVTITKVQVTNILKAYVNAAADDAGKQKRRDAIRDKLKECGAENVSQLEDKHYAAVAAAFKE